MALIEHRERKLAARRRAGELINVLPASEEDPALFFIIDEFPDLIKAAKQNGKDVVTMLERMANKASKVNIWLIFGLQNPTNDDAGSSILKGALTGVVGLGLSEHQSRNLWQSARAEGWDSAPLTVGTYLLRDRAKEHQSPRVAKGLFLPPAERSRLITAALRRPSLLSGEEGVILGGITASPALGETARSGAYELNGERGFTEGSRPQLTVVRDAIHVQRGNREAPVTPRPAPTSRRESLAAFDAQVLHEVPPAHQGSIGPSAIAAQLDVDRSKVTRSLKRLAKDGQIAPAGDGEWSCP